MGLLEMGRGNLRVGHLFSVPALHTDVGLPTPFFFLHLFFLFILFFSFFSSCPEWPHTLSQISGDNLMCISAPLLSLIPLTLPRD